MQSFQAQIILTQSEALNCPEKKKTAKKYSQKIGLKTNSEPRQAGIEESMWDSLFSQDFLPCVECFECYQLSISKCASCSVLSYV